MVWGSCFLFELLHATDAVCAAQPLCKCFTGGRTAAGSQAEKLLQTEKL